MQFTTTKSYPVAISSSKPDSIISGSISFSFTKGETVGFNCFEGDVVYVEKPGILTASSPVYDAGPFYYTIIGQNEFIFEGAENPSPLGDEMNATN